MVSARKLQQERSMDVESKTSPSRPMQDSAPVSRQPNLRNPLPLSAAQEAQVKDIYYKRVRSHCAQEIKGCSNSIIHA